MIQRRYAGDGEQWEEVSEQEYVRRTEWAGFYHKGEALEALARGPVQTPYARFRLVGRGAGIPGGAAKSRLAPPREAFVDTIKGSG